MIGQRRLHSARLKIAVSIDREYFERNSHFSLITSSIGARAREPLFAIRCVCQWDEWPFVIPAAAGYVVIAIHIMELSSHLVAMKISRRFIRFAWVVCDDMEQNGIYYALYVAFT